MKLSLKLPPPASQYPQEGEIWRGPSGTYIVAGAGSFARFVNLATGLFFTTSSLFGITYDRSLWSFVAKGLKIEEE